jgi:hypothetical protein
MGQSASFTPRTLTLSAMGTGVKQSNSDWNSQCDRQVRMPPSIIIVHESTAHQAKWRASETRWESNPNTSRFSRTSRALRAAMRGAGWPFQHPTNVPIRIAQHPISPGC